MQLMCYWEDSPSGCLDMHLALVIVNSQMDLQGLDIFLTDATDDNMGEIYSTYIFQLSFATTATTIVSGAMAERTNLKAYMIYSFFNTFFVLFSLSLDFGSEWLFKVRQ